jgi:hypothetical protein
MRESIVIAARLAMVLGLAAAWECAMAAVLGVDGQNRQKARRRSSAAGHPGNPCFLRAATLPAKPAIRAGTFVLSVHPMLQGAMVRLANREESKCQ